jgi:hypothetical protein
LEIILIKFGCVNGFLPLEAISRLIKGKKRQTTEERAVGENSEYLRKDEPESLSSQSLFNTIKLRM